MKMLLLSSLLVLMPFISQARDTMDGCGLGWEVTSDATMVATTTRGTTNVFVPPTFGMTTGTLGCKKLDLAANETESATYVLNNYANLRQELASGRGEYVEGLFEVMNCKKADQIKENYHSVVSPAQDGADLYNNLKAFCG